MKRRGFFGALAGAIAAPTVVKELPKIQNELVPVITETAVQTKDLKLASETVRSGYVNSMVVCGTGIVVPYSSDYVRWHSEDGSTGLQQVAKLRG